MLSSFLFEVIFSNSWIQSNPEEFKDHRNLVCQWRDGCPSVSPKLSNMGSKLAKLKENMPSLLKHKSTQRMWLYLKHKIPGNSSPLEG